MRSKLRIFYRIRHFLLLLLLLFLGFYASGQTPDTLQYDSAVEQQEFDTLAPQMDTIPTADTAAQDTTRMDSSLISPDALEDKVDYQAEDSIYFDFGEKRVYLYNQGEVKYQDIELEADYIYIDWANSIIHAEGVEDSNEVKQGTPVFQEAGQSYESKKMTYNFKTQKGKLYDIKTEEGGGYIHGTEIKKDSDNTMYVKSAKYTTCDLDQPHFHLAANKIKMIPDDKIVSGPAYMVLADVPLPLVVPFGFFPSQKKQSSGILIPSYGESRNRGFFLQNGGYYFGISDQVDVILRGDIYSMGSWRLNLNSRYAVRYRFKGDFQFEYAYNMFGERESPDFSLSKDVRILWTHNQDQKARPNSNFRASVNAGSSNSLRNNSMNAQDIVTNTMNSSISYTNSLGRSPFSLTAGATHNQNLSTGRITVAAPNATLNMQRVFPFKEAMKGKNNWISNLGVNYTLNFKNQIATQDSLLFRQESLNEMQYGLNHIIPVSTNIKLFKYFTFNPEFRYQGYLYFDRTRQDYVNMGDRDTLISTKEYGIFDVHEYQINGNLTTNIYGTFNFNRGGIVAMRHVLVPTISFNYRPDFSDARFDYYGTYFDERRQQFNEYSYFQNGIFGGPGANQQGNIALNLQNNLEMKVIDKSDTVEVKTKKIKLFESFNINGAYNAFADSLNFSPISVTARTVILENYSIQFNSTFNPYAINEDGQIFDRSHFEETGGWLRLTNLSFVFSTSLNPEAFKRENARQNFRDAMLWGSPYDYRYVDFDIPWNLSVNYNFNYRRPAHEPTIDQTLNLSGDFRVTDKWKVGFRTGYSFEEGDFSFTSVDIFRDLHCWQMSFNWIPFGFRRSYLFNINVKSAVLQDLKLDKRQNFWDF